MRSLVILIGLVAICTESFAQVYVGLRGKTIDEMNNRIPENSEVFINTIFKDELGTIQAEIVTTDSSIFKVRYAQLDRIAYSDWTTVDEFWKTRAMISGLYKQLAAKGRRMDIRNRLIESSGKLALALQAMEYSNDFVEEYIYSQLSNFIPQSMPTGLPVNIHITILENAQPECLLLPDGTFLVNSGLLSLMENRDELIAILVQQLAHYTLDHYMYNFNRQLSRESLNELLGLTAWMAGTGSEILIASKRKVTLGGQLSQSAAMLASLLMDSVKFDLGTNYTLKQALQSDALCRDLLNRKNVSGRSLDRALVKIKQYYTSVQNGSKVDKLDKRIIHYSGLGASGNVDIPFCKLISGVYTANARAEFVSGNYLKCCKLLDKKIALGTALEDDYLIKSACISKMYGMASEESYRLISMAEKLNVARPHDLYYRKGLTLMHMNRYAEAEISFKRYLQVLSEGKTEKDGASEIKKLIFQCQQMR